MVAKGSIITGPTGQYRLTRDVCRFTPVKPSLFELVGNSPAFEKGRMVPLWVQDAIGLVAE